jgi:hypothetical protein
VIGRADIHVDQTIDDIRIESQGRPSADQA